MPAKKKPVTKKVGVSSKKTTVASTPKKKTASTPKKSVRHPVKSTSKTKKNIVSPKKKSSLKKSAVKKTGTKKPARKKKNPTITEIEITHHSIEPKFQVAAPADTRKQTDQPQDIPPAPEVQRDMDRPQNKVALWLSVGTVTLLVALLWIYSLQYTILDPTDHGPSFTEANPQVDQFVGSVQADWSDFEENVDEFENLIDERLTEDDTSANIDPTSKRAPDEVPATEELNNLFSDIN